MEMRNTTAIEVYIDRAKIARRDVDEATNLAELKQALRTFFESQIADAEKALAARKART